MSNDKANILIVDDLPEKILVLESILEELGENIVTARSGAEALQYVLQQQFAVILLDINMPDMDGLETAALIRQRKKSAHVPIIFVTAYADELHTAQGYELGAVDYILSPVVPDILRTKVKVFVDLFHMTEQVKKQAEEHIALMQEQAARAAAEENNRRLAFLVKAGNVLGRSLDYEATARDIAELPIPSLADLCIVTLLEPVDLPGKTIVARAAEGDEVNVEIFEGREGIPEVLADMTERVSASGNKEFLPVANLAEVDQVSTAIVLPLHARSRVMGTLVLALGSSGRCYSASEVPLIEALASRAASALDNALLYNEVQRADREKNNFLSMLAHELRNPLAPIRSAVNILQQASEVSNTSNISLEQQQWARQVIDRQVSQLVRLVDDLLDVSRITRGKIRLYMEAVAVETVVAQAVETSRPLIDARGHTLEVLLPAEPLWLYGDAVRLAQVLTNLLNNAAKYTDEGGRVWLTAAPEEGEVVLSVRDTGVGIPPSMMSSIFELFTQVDRSLDRSQGGLGIGLTLVRHLVRMHDGSVRAVSHGPNQGSEFIVRLPALTSADQPPATATTLKDSRFLKLDAPVKAPLKPDALAKALKPDAAQETNGRDHQRLLIVDDNRDAADSLAMLLRMEGYEVRSVYDGQAALDTVQTFQPHLVLLDIGLPGMNGYEVARRLRQQRDLDDMVLVALTGYSQKEDRQRSLEVGFNHFFVKPVDLQELTALFTAPTT